MLAFALLTSLLAAAPDGDVPVLHPLDIRVAPWADVYVDGELVVPHATQVTIHVDVGPHVVTLRHPLARDQVHPIEVPAQRSLVVRLEPLPAFVVVKTAVDADVVVAGTARGRTWTSELSPLAVDVPAWRAAAASEVRISRPGREDLVTTAVLRAGETTTIAVELDPTAPPARDGAPARAKIPVERVPSFGS